MVVAKIIDGAEGVPAAVAEDDMGIRRRSGLSQAISSCSIDGVVTTSSTYSTANIHSPEDLLIKTPIETIATTTGIDMGI